jgi:CRISPR-associated endonuclease/helicase Cas3
VLLNASIAWGKLKRDSDGIEIGRLDLLSHCVDVAAVVAAILSVPTIRRRLETLAGRVLDSVDAERLSALGFFHDIGKANQGFQSKALSDKARRDFLRRIGSDWSECGHTREIGPLFADGEIRSRFEKVLPLEAMLEWDPGLTLLLAAVSHHGTPLRDADLESEPRSVWAASSGYDPLQALAELAEAALTHFPAGFGPVLRPLPDAPAFAHAFAGLVSLADWIGSSTSVGFFPYDLGIGHTRWSISRLRAVEVLKAMRIDVDALRSDLRRRQPAFGDVFRDLSSDQPLQPTELQQAMGNLAFGPVVVVEAETGSGKTEAALWRFRTLFEAGEVDSLAFVLPTRVSAVQIEGRVDQFFKQLFPDASLQPNVVLAVPGYLRVSGVDAEGMLAPFDVLWPDKDAEGNAHLRWAAENSKRYLAAACAVGTIDQVLLSGLRVRHAHLRGFSMMRSLLVVDEVHASDLYMTLIMQGILERHAAAGGHALLLSATLGVAARAGLIHGDSATPGIETSKEREAAPYPCISDAHGTREIAASPRVKTVQIALRPWLADAAAIATHSATAVQQGARVLIVRNTVRGVIDVQRELEAILGLDHPGLFRCAGVACPHHGRYAAADRRLLDAAIERFFGKQSTAGPTVLCGSQTLEQSLDIDADLLITDLAPMDVLLQRIGRLHRHATRNRPEGFIEARVIVVTPEERDLSGLLRTGPDRHGLGGFVYPNLLSIDATWSELAERPQLVIPDDNRVLVERSTDPARLQANAAAKGQAWIEHLRQLQGKGLGQRQEALFSRLDWSTEWDDSAFPNAEEKIRTRLGAEAIRIPLPTPWTSPFGSKLQELAIPAWMWHGPTERWDVVVEEQVGALSIAVNEQRFRYSRVGLEKEPKSGGERGGRKTEGGLYKKSQDSYGL